MHVKYIEQNWKRIPHKSHLFICPSNNQRKHRIFTYFFCCNILSQSFDSRTSLGDKWLVRFLFMVHIFNGVYLFFFFHLLLVSSIAILSVALRLSTFICIVVIPLRLKVAFLSSVYTNNCYYDSITLCWQPRPW